MYVGGLHYNCRERDLERFFKRYGRLRDCLIKNGYGFVVSVLSCNTLDGIDVTYVCVLYKSFCLLGLVYIRMCFPVEVQEND